MTPEKFKTKNQVVPKTDLEKKYASYNSDDLLQALGYHEEEIERLRAALKSIKLAAWDIRNNQGLTIDDHIKRIIDISREALKEGSELT